MEAKRTAFKRSVLLAFFSFTFSILLLSCTSGDKNGLTLLELSGRTMGTTYLVKAMVDVEDESDAVVSEQLKQEIDESLAAYNMVMSTYIDDSELSKLNREPEGKWLDISDDLYEILQTSLAISRESSGAFDITIGPLVNLWGFGPQKPANFPAKEDVLLVKEKIGYTHIALDVNKLKKEKDVYIDLSAIAKGHATDLVAEILEAQNIVNYMVEIGGELKIRGHNENGKTWTIGIEKPALGREGTMQAVSGDNVAIATSGEYRNFYQENGVRVSHTISPVTGYPIDHTLASVTVITERGAEADAYATAINVLGPEAGYALAERKNLAAFFIIRDEGTFALKSTPQFEQYMVK